MIIIVSRCTNLYIRLNLFDHQCWVCPSTNAPSLKPRVYNKERGKVSYSVYHYGNALWIVKTLSLP